MKAWLLKELGAEAAIAKHVVACSTALEKTQASVLVEIMAHSKCRRRPNSCNVFVGAACDSLAITIMTLTLAAATRLGVSTETTILFCGMHL